MGFMDDVNRMRKHAEKGAEMRKKAQALKAKGYSNKAIADELGLTENVVRMVAKPKDKA